ncbi:MAG: prevent-host-death protein [Clostridia bacterium]|nr:prevent-host-death protein [Clostridia bacterium]
MTIISPVSDLRNYNRVLENVKAGSPVYLTVNGRGKYTLRAIEDDEEFEKMKAMVQLLTELHRGRESAEKEGYLESDRIHEMLADWRPAE